MTAAQAQTELTEMRNTINHNFTAMMAAVQDVLHDIGADEISSAADGTMHVVHRAPPPGAAPPNA